MSDPTRPAPISRFHRVAGAAAGRLARRCCADPASLPAGAVVVVIVAVPVDDTGTTHAIGVSAGPAVPAGSVAGFCDHVSMSLRSGQVESPDGAPFPPLDRGSEPGQVH